MNQSPTMRDPAGHAARYAEFFRSAAASDCTPERFAALGTEQQVSVEVHRLRDAPDYARRLYGQGAPLADIAAWMEARCARMAQAAEFVARHDSAAIRDGNLVDGNVRDNLAFIALGLLAVDAPGFPARLAALMSPEAPRRNYLVDLLIASFVPGFALARKYKPNKYQAPWTDPVLRALALVPAARAAALGAHMQNWCRIHKPWGWKPDLDTAPGKDNLFGDFAFEVALAVCAFDIDDSSFCEHPYYPRDLVQHYRAGLRGSRDSWRAPHAGPGVTVAAPAPPARADLAKSRRKGAARWVELACDGNVDATEAVLDAIGAARKFKQCDTLLEALQAAGQAIHADIKDDVTVEAQAQGMAAERSAQAFDAPALPVAGAARCSAVLLAFDAFLDDQGYRLAALDLGDDGWHAVAVRSAYRDELFALSAALGIPARPAADLFAD